MIGDPTGPRISQTIGYEKNYVCYCAQEPWNEHFFEDLKEAQRQAKIHRQLTGHTVVVQVKQ